MNTLIVPYYYAPKQLARHIEAWQAYPYGWKFIIVDDGTDDVDSALSVYQNCSNKHDIEIYKVEKDIPWNSHGARNLGAMMAPFGWLFLMDIDTILTAEEAAKVDVNKLNPKSFYTMGRYDKATGAPKAPHPNSYIMHRSLYWETGGMDEDYCGTYGGDGQWRNELLKVGVHEHKDDVMLAYYGRTEYPDISDDLLTRKGGAFHEEYRERLKLKNKYSWNTAKHPIRFPWRQLV